MDDYYLWHFITQNTLSSYPWQHEDHLLNHREYGGKKERKSVEFVVIFFKEESNDRIEQNAKNEKKIKSLFLLLKLTGQKVSPCAFEFVKQTATDEQKAEQKMLIQSQDWKLHGCVVE